MGKKITISVVQNHAINKGGLLLSTEYKNNKTKLLWQCKEGHQWKACWHGIKDKNHWCPSCVGLSRPDISVLQQHALDKNGLLLSTKYKNICSKLLWQCKEGHQWNACWNDIKNTSWCPVCSKNIKPALSELQNYAISKNGLLLSSNYVTARQKLKWQCKEGHQWKACWDCIKNKNTWCPECSSFKTERLVRSMLESKIKFGLIKQRFYYDTTNKRKFYEFDGYNEVHKVAFEYHGYQHYIYPNHWHRTEDEFLEAQQRDRDKISYCKENNITLFIIPCTEEKNLTNYIDNLLMAV